ncbi:hypothetical protein [Mucilaginibacter sp. HD30]
MKTFLRYATLLVLFQAFIVRGQSKTSLNGVYAGVEIMPSAMGGMSRNDVVILFRPDGTYNDDMRKSGWQQRVSGRYTLSGRTVSLRTPGDNRAITYTLDNDGNMNAGSFNLVRQPTDNNIPNGNYEFSSAGGSGGGASGTAVGSFSNKAFYFDGQGNFSTNSQTAVVVSGSNVGGGNSHKSSGGGTYKISKGVLTLTFANGATEVHSFFCRPGYDPIMAVIDGDIYFVKDRRKK